MDPHDQVSIMSHHQPSSCVVVEEVDSPSALVRHRGSRPQPEAEAIEAVHPSPPSHQGAAPKRPRGSIAPNLPSSNAASESTSAAKGAVGGSVGLLQWLRRRDRVVKPKESFWIFLEVSGQLMVGRGKRHEELRCRPLKSIYQWYKD